MRAMRLPTLLAILGCLFTSTAYADPFASDWSKGQKSSARLLALGAGSGGANQPRLRAAIEIGLAPGAHTYWKAPGDAGIAPVVSFEGSANLAGAEMHFPVPRRFDEAGATVFGYLGEVLFPLALRPADPSLPVQLAVKIDYAACDRICVPEQAMLRLTLPADASGAGAFDARILAAAARVPTSADGAAFGLEAVNYAAGAEGAPPQIEIDVRAPAGAQLTELFVAPPDGWFFEVGEPRRRDAAHLTFPVKVVEMPREAGTESPPVDFVLAVDGESVEFSARLDARRLKR